MKANELRIGNWIYDNEVGFKDTFQACSESIVNNEKFGTDYSAITLTEEWLVKFGLKDGWHDYKVGNHFFLEYLFERYDLRLKYSIEESKFITHIDYVHQLQNLYFALTGIELEIEKT